MLSEYYTLTIDRDGHDRVTETFPSAYAAWRYIVTNYPTLNEFATGSAYAYAHAQYVGTAELSIRYGGGYIVVSVERVTPVQADRVRLI